MGGEGESETEVENKSECEGNKNCVGEEEKGKLDGEKVKVKEGKVCV